MNGNSTSSQEFDFNELVRTIGIPFRRTNGELSLSRFLFLIWSAVAFVLWSRISYSATPVAIADIPPSVIAVLGLLAGGEGTKDYLIRQITRKPTLDQRLISGFLFGFCSIAVFGLWLSVSYSNNRLEDIPPTVVTALGLLLGGEGARDYLLRRMPSKGNKFNQYSLSRILFVLFSLAVFILWLMENCSTNELTDIPKTVVTLLGLLAGGESTKAYLHWRNTQ